MKYTKPYRTTFKKMLKPLFYRASQDKKWVAHDLHDFFAIFRHKFLFFSASSFLFFPKTRPFL